MSEDLNQLKMKLIPYKVEEVEQKAETLPYGIKTLGAPEFWKDGETGEGIVVAILDTGCDVNHPDLKDRILAVRNFTHEGSANDVTDGSGHGTHVAGTIGASENGSGVVGVAPGVKFLILKVLDSSGGGSYQGIIDAINYATKWRGANGEKVRVMNMSLGGSYNAKSLHDAIKNAVQHEIAVVCASGNEGDNEEESHEYSFPGLYNEVIEVSASDEKNKLAPFSNNNLEVDCIAPGVNVLSTYPNSTYAKLSGTSMATPHVTGAVALLISKAEKQFKRPLTESEIYANLVKNCFPLGYKASSEGHGLVQLNLQAKVKKVIEVFRTIGWC